MCCVWSWLHHRVWPMKILYSPDHSDFFQEWQAFQSKPLNCSKSVQSTEACLLPCIWIWDSTQSAASRVAPQSLRNLASKEKSRVGVRGGRLDSDDIIWSFESSTAKTQLFPLSFFFFSFDYSSPLSLSLLKPLCVVFSATENKSICHNASEKGKQVENI